LLDGERLETHLKEITERGYTIVENAIEPDLVEGLREDLDRLERELDVRPSSNEFEGEHTIRIYNLLAHGKIYERIPVHGNVLPIAEGVLDRGCLVSSLSSISIGPGETEQPIHADDQLIPLAKPHAPLVCNSMWALTEFTEANGATRIVPGSHRRAESPEYGRGFDGVAAEMAAGSVLVWDGGLWHGGGANRTDERRVGIAMNYCAGYIRQQENQQLGIPLGTVRGFEPRLRALVGYTVYHSLIGHIDKKSPEEALLGEGRGKHMVWDA